MINTVMQNYLLSQPDLTSRLAAYDGRAAIFDRVAPPDNDPGWQGEAYPRIVFTLLRTRNPERGTDGVLTFRIFCENGKQAPEEIEAVLHMCVDGFFFAGGADTLQAIWDFSQPLTQPENHVSGTALAFSVFSFPARAGEAPDPAALLSAYSKAEFPEAFVIGLDEAVRPVWKPNDAEPAFYWRLQDTAPCAYIGDTWDCIWLTATLRLHAFSDTTEEMLCRRICDGLQTRRRLLFPEGDGQLMIDDARVTPGNDVQRAGQVTLTGSFGVLRPEEPEQKLRHIHYDDQK